MSSLFADARETAWSAASVLLSEVVDLPEAGGRMSAGEVHALIDVPHYASSAMDGWAVAGPPPWSLVAHTSLSAGQATPIVTGGLVPEGTEAVLRSEHGLIAADTLDATVIPARMKHIRPAGEEARRGELVIGRGIRLNPAHVAVAAGCGHDGLPVTSRPRVGFVFTGAEVVTSGIPTPGFVRDSFAALIPRALEHLGAVETSRVRVGDGWDDLRDAIQGADVDLVVTTGGTGDSPVDHLRAVLADLGADLIVDGIAIRPGAPTLLARLPDGPLVIGLPGNPLAAMTGLLTVAPPIIARMQGLELPALPRIAVADAMPGLAGRTILSPYRSVDGVAVRCERTGSGMLRGLASADGILVIPGEGVAEGDLAEMLPLPW